MMVPMLVVALLGQATPVVEPGVEVRALTVTILDEKGQPVESLARDDVALLENGVTREITSFREDERPLSVAIVVDTSQVLRSDYRLSVVDALVAFVARLPAGTRYALWTTGDRPTKVLDYTEDKAAASKALVRVFPQGGNYMLDALSEASSDLKKETREGDRTVVVAISGTGPELSYRDKYRAADEAEENADLYLIAELDAFGSDFESRTNLSYVFDRLARHSGGNHEIVLSTLGADSALRKLSPWLESGYRVAYATVTDLKKRELELTVARPGSKVVLPARSESGH